MDEKTVNLLCYFGVLIEGTHFGGVASGKPTFVGSPPNIYDMGLHSQMWKVKYL